MATVNDGRHRVGNEKLRNVPRTLLDTFQKNVNLVRDSVIQPRNYNPPTDYFNNGLAANFHSGHPFEDLRIFTGRGEQVSSATRCESDRRGQAGRQRPMRFVYFQNRNVLKKNL